MKIAAFNAGLRTAGLGCRFILSMFMARFMTLADVGALVLMTGVTGLAPSVFGLGLNYFLNRSLVGVDHDEAIRLARDRLLTSVIAAIVAVLALLLASSLLDAWVPVWLFAAILMLEMLGMDQQMALLGRFRTTLANLLLFLRTGAWTLPFIALAYARPEWRTIEAMCWFWLGGLIVSHVLLAVLFARPFVDTLRSVMAWRGRFARDVGRRFWKIYLSDLGLAGSVYIDRFIVSSLAGVNAAGIYFFYLSIVNSVYVICTAATLQVYRQELRLSYMSGGVSALHDMLRKRLRSTVIFTGLGLAAAGPATYIAARLTEKQELLDAMGVLPILLVAYLFRIISDFLSSAIAMSDQDNAFAAFNILGLGLTVLACVALTPLLGLYGAAIGNLVVSVGMVVLRWLNWRRFLRVALGPVASAPAPLSGSAA